MPSMAAGMRRRPRPGFASSNRCGSSASRAAQRRSRLLPVALALLVVAALAAGGYEVYARTLGRPTEVQTAYVTIQPRGDSPA